MQDIKQGKENTELVKDADSDKNGYILQDNTKTKVGASFIIGVLVLIIAAIVVSLYYFQTSA